MTSLPEVLKSLSDVPKPVIEAGVSLIISLLGKPFQETGELLADQIHAWRWRNRIRIAQKAAERLANMEISPKVLPPGFLVPLLESCGDIKDESLQSMWASLLAEGVRSKRSQQPAFRKTLESLSPEDAKWLMSLRRDELAEPTQRIRTCLLPRRGTTPEPLGGSGDFNGRLLALGLLAPCVSRELDSIIREPEYSGTGLALYHFELSDYARQFLAVVSNGELPWPHRTATPRGTGA